MLIVAAVLFAVAALGGLTMAYIYFKKHRNPPIVLATLHGALAAAALLVLLRVVMQAGRGGLPAWALGLFVVAALGGFFLFSYHIRGRPLPSKVVVIHATVAIVAFVLLLAGIAAA
jgi:hypothetical protein